ncbi:MAG: hypothetical protein K8S97_14660, partial [Anaerolineae bacterium]|nr:hypothetical protein [Anaerolineae bacterium]
MVAVFDTCDAVVLPGGSCAAFMRKEVPHLLADDPGWHDRALQLGAKTFELSQFLVNEAVWEPRAATDTPTVTYHD